VQTKAVTIEVLTPDNKKVLSRHRFVAGRDEKKGTPLRFTEAGVDQIVNTFISKFEMDNPGHQYRLVECSKSTFRLVWGDHAPIKKTA